jgi:hypothetical protein
MASFGATLPVEAVDRISATIAPSAEEAFEILADQTQRLHMILIAASRYVDVTVGASEAELEPLLGPMVATGGMIRFLRANGAARVVVNNAGADDLTIDIVVCRDPNA